MNMNKLLETLLIFQYEIKVMSFILIAVGILGGMILINRKLKQLTFVQLQELDDVTSFNRLIDDEIGILRKEQEEITQAVLENGNQNPPGDSKLFNEAPYTQAIQLAKRGYERKEIISLCSLTESEADLILALHSNIEAA